MSALRATGLRLALAIGLSFALWAFVSFSENPEERISFEAVPVEVRNLPSGLVMVDQNGLPNATLPPVNVTIETDRATRADLRQADLRSYVDLRDMAPGDRAVPINIEATRPNLTFTLPEGGLRPASVSVRLEELITTTVPLTLTIQGNVPFSFELGQPEVTLGGQVVQDVQVRGPQSRVERVKMARATANVEQLRASYVSLLPLQGVDENGQPVEGVTLEPATVNVRIPINPIVGLKLVPVLGTIEGFPAPGYTVVNIRSNPPLINLTGSSGTLDTVDQVSTAPVDISGASGLITRTVPLRFPLGTSPQAGEPSEATVTVEIAPLNRVFQVQLPVPVQATNIGNVLVSISPGVVQAQLAGSNEVLNQLNTATLLATVDVGRLGPGTYQLTPQLTPPNGVTLVGTLPVVTVTLRAPPTAVPPPTSAPRPEPSETPAAPSGTPEPTRPAPTAEPALPSATPEAPTQTP